MLRMRLYERISFENRPFRSNGGRMIHKISGRRGRPTKHSSSQKTRLNDLSYGLKSGPIFLPFCHNPRVWTLTDGQTDGRTAFSSLDRVCIPRSAVKTQSHEVCVRYGIFEYGASNGVTALFVTWPEVITPN